MPNIATMFQRQPQPRALTGTAKALDEMQEKTDLLIRLHGLLQDYACAEGDLVWYLRENPSPSGAYCIMPNEGLEDMKLAHLRALVTRWPQAWLTIRAWLSSADALPME